MNMAGYSKITGCCRQARLDGYEYAWVDSCCIDKSSSAELSEAINSMFKWYLDAEVCYAYLSDVEERSEFGRSQWFTRGWTLQELLAPHFLVFYDKNWKEIDTKLRLRKELESITGIAHLMNFEDASVAQKMSWASRRTTTRVEDEAYCLMGIFGVNMPPLYGEGKKAFLRLQLEIIRISDDESIFAWLVKGEERQETGLLAQSTRCFKYSHDIVEPGFSRQRTPYTMTNKGLRIETQLLSTTAYENWDGIASSCFMPLHCTRRGDWKPIVLPVKNIEKDQFLRLSLPGVDQFLDLARPDLQADQPEGSTSGPKHHICYFKQEEEEGTVSRHVFTVKLFTETRCQYEIAGIMTPAARVWTPAEIIHTTTVVLLDPFMDEAAVLFYRQYASLPYPFALFLGLDSKRPTIDIICKNHVLPSGESIWANKKRPSLDKLSHKLMSGDTVSYSLRKNGRSGLDKKYVLDVKVVGRGVGWGASSVPWPDPDPGADLCQVTSPLEIRARAVLDSDLGKMLVRSVHHPK